MTTAPVVFRPPQIDLASIIKQPHPVIDLRLQEFDQSATKLSRAVVAFKNNAIAVIADRRATYIADTKKLSERIKSAEAETHQCKIKEIDLLAELEHEQTERKELEVSIASLRRRISALREKYAEVDEEIARYRTVVANLKSDRQHDTQTLASTASSVLPALNALQNALSCKLEGIGTGQLLIRFWNVDPSDPQREVSCVVDVSDTVYRVLTSSPPLPMLSSLAEELNSSRDVYRFVIQLRSSFARNAIK
ncbi:chromosome segregation protein Spc25-domain-containing protein [Pterulicium gracile]|uniref:Kinetochore protein SPC25 n=1 Tax=Pterulicium gracile TaxID=1884261 RepID=A0A5C3R0V8_9AGAR|nr:chromosome segregation protein Spc25-domain-containing protein [Pterula gracilis]